MKPLFARRSRSASWSDEVSFQCQCSLISISILNKNPIRAVLALYSKTGGKNGKHSSVSESSNVAAISYMAVQVFEHMYAQQFRSVPAATAMFQTHQFLLLSSLHFLTLLDYKESSEHILELSPEDLNRFRTLQKADKQLQAAFKLSKKRGGNTMTVKIRVLLYTNFQKSYRSIITLVF